MYFDAHEVGARADARRRDSTPPSHADTMKKTICAATLVLAAASASMHAQKDWTYYGQDQGATRFSTLAQIKTDNVANLKRAWTFHTGDKTGFFESTPLVVDGVMYSSSAQNGDLRARRRHRRADLEVRADGRTTRRGVSVLARRREDAAADLRVGRHGAAARSTRRPASAIPDFGEGGFVDMGTTMKSPASIYKDLLIVQRQQAGDPRVERPHRRADLDVQSDRAARRSEPQDLGRRSLEDHRRHEHVGTTCRSTPSAASSTCRCRCRGERLRRRRPAWRQPVSAPRSWPSTSRPASCRWHQQLVHHDIWDNDLGAAPTLVDVVKNGKTIPAVAADHEDGPAVHLRSRDRRADLRHGRASGAAEHGARREDRRRRSRSR